MKELNSKVAVVTGAAMGMGKELSKRLLQQGCKVAMVDIKPKALERALVELSSLGECMAFECDISRREDVYRLADEVAEKLGTVSVLVNNAGIVKAAELLKLEDEVIEKIIIVNLTAQFWTCKAFLPGMLKQNEGHIVNFSSAGGLLAIPSLTAYCASKFGVIGFTDALRQEIRRKKSNIGFTYVCPNTTNTGMFKGSKTVAGTKLLSPSLVADRVLKAIIRNRPVVAIPSFPVRYLIPLLKALMPVRSMDWINDALGMADANDSWVGRNEEISV